MVGEEYEIHILLLFKNSDNMIFDKNIKILDSLIDYTKADFDENEAMKQYYRLLASPLLFNKRITEKYDCIIACNHNAPSYFASYISCCAKILWIRGDIYYLENSSLILKKIIEKMGIQLENTVIYGTSAGGFLSVIMGIYLKGAKVVADNAQFDAANWIFKDALDSAVTFCFDNIGDALRNKERFNVVDAFEKYSYVPEIYIHVNICSKADNSTQLIPFLNDMENLRNIREYNDIKVIMHYEPEKGHDGIGMEAAINFLYSVLDGGFAYG
jgi:hypothetical protein